MHFINGVRQSPFSQWHWTDGLDQHEIVKALMANGAAVDYLKKLSYEAVREDHFAAIDRGVFLEKAPELDEYLKFDIGASLFIMLSLEKDQDNVIAYKYKEGGALIRSRKDEGIIHADVLVEEAGKMDLNNAQIVELEQLLNTVGRSLNITLPTVQEPTDQEKYRAIKHLTAQDIAKHPRRYYDIFLDDMLVAGTPVNMSAKQFREYAEKVLKPS